MQDPAPLDADDARVPRWVVVFGVVVLLLVAAFVVLHLTGRGFSGGHGP